MSLLPSPVRNATTRLCAAVAIAAVALSGCAADDSTESNSPDAPSTAESTDSAAPEEANSGQLPEAEGETSYPLTLSSPWGETVLEERPERIAVLGGSGDGEAALALGATIVTSPWEKEHEWAWAQPYSDQFEEAPFADPWGEAPPLETLAAAKPDLILAHTYLGLEDSYSQLSDIAPVLAPATEDEMTWEDTILAVGEALDLQNTAQRKIDEVSEAIEESANEHPEYEGKTVSVLINRGAESGIQFLNTKGSYTEYLLTALGFAPHPNVEELSVEERSIVSPENLSLVDTDALVIGQHGGKGTPEEGQEWLETMPLFQNLTAVQEGRVSNLEFNPETQTLDIAWAFSYPDVLNIPYILDTMNKSFGDLFSKSSE